MDDMVATMWYGIKGWNSFGVFVSIYMLCIYVCLIVSSPYLFVFGDDRVRGTREQMMLQVDLVRPRARAGLVWEKVLSEFLCFMVLE